MSQKPDPLAILCELRKTGAYSDLTVKCGNFEILAHKNIVCPQSQFFRSACENRKWKEGETGVVELQAVSIRNDDNTGCDNPHAVELMFDFLYCRDYSAKPGTTLGATLAHTGRDAWQELMSPSLVAPSTSTEQDAESVFKEVPGEDDIDDPATTLSGVEPSNANGTTDINSEAERDHIPRMKKKTTKKMKKKRNLVPDSDEYAPKGYLPSALAMHAELYALGFKYGIFSLQQHSLEKFEMEADQQWHKEQFIEAISIAFNAIPNDDDRLQRVLKRITIDHAEELVGDPSFEATVAEIPELGYDLFREACNRIKTQRVCPRCKAIFLSECASTGCTHEYNLWPQVRNSSRCDLQGPCTRCLA